MSLSKTQFFFNRNSSVLSTLVKSKVTNFKLNCGICNNLTTSPVKKSNVLNSIYAKKSPHKILSDRSLGISKRKYSTTAQQINIEYPKKAFDPSISFEKSESSNTGNTDQSFVSKNYVGYWLIGTSTMIFGIVVIGGLTRLTESGLSITEWKPVTGSIPPLNQQEWEIEFSKYKESPEFKLLNSHITLEEFKFIFFMEWIHRLWGRTIGLVFVLPTLYFIRTRKVTRPDSFKLLGLCCLLGFQGFIGWWMVKSGLDEEQLQERKSKPTVSQYRLTTHLGVAFSLYLASLAMGFRILQENKWIKNVKDSSNVVELLNHPSVLKLGKYSRLLLGLTFLTAMSGGLVAGLDAGLIYNTFPHMGDDYLPSKNELFDPTFSRTPGDLFWRNILENPTTVQLNHRILATTTFFSVLALNLYAFRIRRFVPKKTMKLVSTTMGIACAQVALGITTLIYLVPIPLAAAHQAGALALLTSVLALCASLKRPSVMINSIFKSFKKSTK